MKYFLLLKEDQFFDCKDPEKFYEKLKEIAKNKEIEVETILNYYLDKHLKNIGILTFINNFDEQALKQFLINAQNMTELLKKWTNAN